MIQIITILLLRSVITKNRTAYKLDGDDVFTETSQALEERYAMLISRAVFLYLR
jgi:hypothetical protein